MTRDNPQRILMGRGKQYGTGTIPKSAIGDITMARGFPNLIDTVQIRHRAGGYSQLQFKAYEQGREAWQGETLTGGIWFDEEPPIEIYSEGITRLAPGACAFLTATPLLGMSDVVRLFYPHPEGPDRHLTQMDIEDAEHYTPAERAQRIASYPPHEREARAKGIPMLGSGRIFPVADSVIEEDALDMIPSHWPQLIAIDFGFEHPFAAVHGAWDRDADVVHIVKTYRESGATPPIHVAALKPWGSWLRCAWPHDGTQTQKGEGVTLAEIYRKAGLKMLPEHATFHSGGYHVEPGIAEMLTRMQTKRLRVARHLQDWFAEFHTYHRKNGKIVKERDDLLDATRALIMSLRYARTNTLPKQPVSVGMDYSPLA
jgi:phage terminase large subunit-like protein